MGTVKGAWVDTPPAHDLRYFQVDPCARRDKKDRLLECSPTGEPNEYSLVTNRLRVVGKIGQFTVYDLTYFRADSGDAGLQSILVGTGDQMHEIYFQQNNWGILFPAEIVLAGQQPVIKAS